MSTKMTSGFFITVSVLLLGFCQASVRKGPFDVCNEACNTTDARTHIGYEKCMDGCPDCSKYGSPENPFNQTNIHCEDKCVKSDHVQMILCRNECPGTWCLKRTNAYEQKETGPSRHGLSITQIVWVAGGFVAFSAIIGIAIYCFYRRFRGLNPKPTTGSKAVTVEQDPEGSEKYMALLMNQNNREGEPGSHEST